MSCRTKPSRRCASGWRATVRYRWKTRFILRDVCDGLAYAHQRGIVNRDIKPDNVLLSGRHAMITDFGVSKATMATTSGATASTAAVTLGTPAYMAPEQITGDAEVDQRADIYSVGVMAYELLAGRPPFVGDSHRAVLWSHLNEAPAPLTTYRSDVPALLAGFVAKCMEKQPADRWSSVEEMIQRLDALAVARSAPSPPTKQRLGRTPAIAAGACVVAAISVFVWQVRPAPEASWRARWANARIDRVTDFPGSGRLISPTAAWWRFSPTRAAFDVFVTRVGSDQSSTDWRAFPQLSARCAQRGILRRRSNVWFGQRSRQVSMKPSGGPVRPFLATAVMAAWSPDGSKFAYHETVPGDPIYRRR